MKPRVGVVQFQAVSPEGNERPLATGITYELARRLSCIGGVEANAILPGKSGPGGLFAPGASDGGAFEALFPADRPLDRLGDPDAPDPDSHWDSDYLVTGRAHVGDGLLVFYRLYEAETGRLIRDSVVTGTRTSVFRLLDDLAQECRTAMGWIPGEDDDDGEFTPVQESVDFEAFTEYCLGRESERPRNALDHLERALEIEPGFRIALVEYVSACYQADDCANALRHVDHYLDAFPGDQEILIAAANLCLAFHRVDEGMAWARRALANRPGDVEPNVLMARFLFAREMPQAAATHLDEALRSADGTPEAAYCLGRYFLDLGDFYRSRDYFERCLDADPGYLVALRDLQCCYYELGDFADGIEACEMLLDSDPTDAGTHYNLGLIYQRLGRTHLGMKYFEEAVRHDATFYKALYMLGEYELSNGRPEAALRRFEEAHRAQPGAAEALGRIGDCHWRLGHPRDAYRHYAWAKREDPLFENPRALLLEGTTLAEDDEHREARARFLQALELEDELAEAWSELAWSLILLGKPEEAWNAVVRAVDLDPERPAFLANLVTAAGCLPLGLRISTEARRRVREARERLRDLARRGDVPPPTARRRRRRLLGSLTWYGLRA